MNSVNYAALMLVLGSLLSACGKVPNNSSVTLVDEGEVWHANPLMLVVEINTQGNLRLNRIETGGVDDTNILAERLKTVFKDRESSSISEREVLVEMDGAVDRDDLEKVIEALESVKASPIRVIRSTDRPEQGSPSANGKEVPNEQVKQKE